MNPGRPVVFPFISGRFGFRAVELMPEKTTETVGSDVC